ncbi:MAG: ribosome biogenesis GTPase Der [Actinomycetota bacterium]|nr:ribosome biogenesis GTPase Der [Actinomycetota bacterium]
MASAKPVVAVVGRPNVGKSTLVNRLAGARDSIVGPTPGLTRDRLDAEVSWRGRTFTVSDTGGLVESALFASGGDDVVRKVAASALSAVESADVVMFVVDGQAGVTGEDLALAKRLRRIPVPVIVVANKVDDWATETEASQFMSLGLGEAAPVSALHGRGSGDLLDRLVELLPPPGEERQPVEIPRIAIVGRPNVGKSSLFNRLVGEERAIVHHEPGTTRDSVDSVVEVGGKTYRFVDTAGIRRPTKTRDVEIFSASRTRGAIARSDVAILVVDAAAGATAQDQRIARQVAEAGVAAVIAVNKWDLVQDEEEAKLVERTLEDRLQFVSYAPLVRTSALTKRGVQRILPEIDRVLEGRLVRIPTAGLNELIHQTQSKSPPPRVGAVPPKVLYATQVETAPPTFVLFTTGPIAESWQRFLERRLREEFGFEGNPLRFVIRQRGQKSHGRTQRK